MNQVPFNNYTEQNELYFGQPVPGIQLVERGGQMVGSKLNCTLGKQEEKKRGGEWGEIEGMPVNILNKGLFRFTGFQYTLLLMDYDTFC